jgi:hypothetical protein
MKTKGLRLCTDAAQIVHLRRAAKIRRPKQASADEIGAWILAIILL